MRCLDTLCGLVQLCVMVSGWMGEGAERVHGVQSWRMWPFSGAISSFLERYEAIWSYLELSGIIWNYLGLSRAIWSYLELSGLSFNAIQYYTVLLCDVILSYLDMCQATCTDV